MEPKGSATDIPRWLQLRILRLGFLQDEDVEVGFFPEREEIFVGGECPGAGRHLGRLTTGSAQA